MNGPVAQVISLTNYGNAYTRNMGIDNFDDNSTFRFCDRVEFVIFQKGQCNTYNETIYASSPIKWYEKLANEGCLGYRLAYNSQNINNTPERMLAGFIGGGGKWSIETVMPDHSLFWTAKWDVWDKKAANNRIWRVKYGCIVKSETQELYYNLEDTKKLLLDALFDIKEFADKNGILNFSHCFGNAIETLESDGRIHNGFHKDLTFQNITSDLSDSLLDACQSSWVFGGMGSWNDLGFEGESMKEYNNVSEKLYRAINVAIVAATNDSFGIR